jgi:exodeoxyribonuclease VII large subunit
MWIDARESSFAAAKSSETRMNIDDPQGDASTAQAGASSVLPVGELVRRVASTLERGFALQWVAGEISNLTRAASGHWYFSLKDRDAQVRSVMFRNRNQSVDWAPREGDRVEARVLVGLYVPRGEFQLQVEQMRRAGAGALYEAFLRIKATLERAGLFDAQRKRPLPSHPRVIGVVTSLQAAALRDVVSTLVRRAPHVEVLIFPTPVQGQEAPARIVDAIVAAAHEGARHPIDVLLVVRGGGSIEDLWAFNDEAVARAIAASRVPVVSGVGHETDFTIADFVADVRAPTPTAAAELASPDAIVLAARIAQRKAQLVRSMERAFDTRAQRIDEAVRRLRSPQQRLQSARERLDALTRRMTRARAAKLDDAQRSLSSMAGRLKGPRLDLFAARQVALRDRLTRIGASRLRQLTDSIVHVRQRLALLDPKGILARGYAIATDADGNIVRDATVLTAGQRVDVEVARGRFASRVMDGSSD